MPKTCRMGIYLAMMKGQDGTEPRLGQCATTVPEFATVRPQGCCLVATHMGPCGRTFLASASCAWVMNMSTERRHMHALIQS